VYILQSNINGRNYYGSTGQDSEKRLREYNTGKSQHTKKSLLWTLIWYAAFATKTGAEHFEQYLKFSSGRAFYCKKLILKK